MNLSDKQLEGYVCKRLALPGSDRNEYRQQVNRLLVKLEAVLATNGTFKICKFRRAGSLEKGTSNRPRPGKAVDSDVGVYFEVDDTTSFDVGGLQVLIKELLAAAYPQKSPEDFDDSGDRTFGVVFKGTGLEMNLVPIVALDPEANFGLQYSRRGDCITTSVKMHIDHYRYHARTDPLLGSTLRLAKGWRYWQELKGIQSFHMELILSHLIDQRGAVTSLEEGLRRFFLFVARDLSRGVSFGQGNASAFSDPVVIVDPANAENNVAARIELDEKEAIVSAARRSYETISWAQGLPFEGETIGAWKELFGPNFSID